MQAVFRSTITSAHGAKLVTQDEEGSCEFYCYNAQGELTYRVNDLGYVIEYQRNSFGQAEHFIAYATPLTLNLSQFILTGLTIDIVAANLAPLKDATRDNSVHQTFDQNGRITQVKRDPVLCYIPNSDPSLAPTVALQTPTKIHHYNTFGEVHAETLLIDETNDVWRQTLTWHNALGKEIASLDANGFAKIITYDVRGRKTEEYEYATAIPENAMPDQTTSFAALQALLVPLSDSTKDHHILTSRDVLGRVTGVYHVGIITQSVVSGKQAFTDNPAVTLGVTYTYTDDNKIKTITYPNNSVEINYYDERRYLVAKAHVTRTQPDGTQIRPITYYHVNVHGERVEVFEPAGGCAVNLDPTSEIIPDPISIVAQDRYTRFMRDAKNNILVHADAENNLKQMTHTAAGKMARKYKPTTVADSKGINKRTTHTDETRQTYDELKRLVLSGIYRDGVLQGELAYQHDAFALTASGPGDGTWPEQHKYDKAGKEWATHNSKGGTKLVGRNAAGEETVTIDSMKKIYQ